MNSKDKHQEILNEIFQDDYLDAIIKRANVYFGRERVKWIYRGEKKIRYIDASDLGGDDVVLGVNFVKRFNETIKPGGVIRSLYNLKNTEFSKDATQSLIEARYSFPHLKGALAAFGLTAFQKIIMRLGNSDMYIAKNKEDGIEWLLDDKNLVSGPKHP